MQVKHLQRPWNSTETRWNSSNWDIFWCIPIILWECNYVDFCFVGPNVVSRYISADTWRPINVDSTSMLCRYVEDQISANFHVICTYFFDVISLLKKFTSIPRTFFDIISMVEKSKSFPRIFFDEMSTGKKLDVVFG